MEASREKEHLLSLKVMRLTKSSFITNVPILCEKRDALFRGAGSSSDVQLQDIYPSVGITPKMESFAVGEILMLPQNFGSIYLGETFSCYISVHNDSSHLVKEILVKTDLQTSSQRLTLSGGGTPAKPELPPEGCIDEVIHHEVKELGTHILVCAVSYATPTGENMYFRKFFKFQVLKPLDVKTKFYNAESYNRRHLLEIMGPKVPMSGPFPPVLEKTLFLWKHFHEWNSDEVYLEAQIKNITQSPMVMEKVSLEPSGEYSCRELNQIEGGKNTGETTFGKFTYLNPMDTRQYLYCLKAKPIPGSNRPPIIKGVSNIGKLDTVWKTHMGEKGRLQTSQLQRMAPGYGDVKLNVTQVPDSVPVEKPFNVKCRFTSCCERTMDMKLVLNNSSNGLYWLGVSGRELGKLGPGACMEVELTLLAATPGLQNISGLRLTDTYLKRTYEHDDIAQVFVYSQEEGA